MPVPVSDLCGIAVGGTLHEVFRFMYAAVLCDWEDSCKRAVLLQLSLNQTELSAVMWFVRDCWL